MAHIYSVHGSSTVAFEVVPLSPFPFTSHAPAINDAVALTHRAGNGTSINSTSNINLNTQNTNFNSLSVTACNVQGASWFANLGGGYVRPNNSTATGGGTLSYNGITFPVSQYNCTIALTGTHVACNAYGVAQTSLNAYNNGGVWAWSGFLQIAGAANGFGGNMNVSWDGSIQMTPKPFVSLTPDSLYDISGNPWFLGSTLSTLTTIPFITEAFVSSMIASTLTMKATENVAILADLSSPTFLGTGVVAINANSNVDLMANYDITAGAHHNIGLTAWNDINLNATSNTYLNNGGFVQFNVDHIGMYRGYLDMGGNIIQGVGKIYFANGAGFNADPSGHTDIYGKGFGYYFSLINGGSYLSFRPSGEVFINSASNDINMQALSNIGLRTPSGQYITLEQFGTGNQCYIQIRPGGEIVQNARNYFEFIAGGGSSNIYMTAAYTEFRGNVSFNDSNRYIGNLGHIYGSTSAPGGGLAIDYMYGMFFNSAGHNANLYADAGALHMINYNTGIDIAGYNPNGTGSVSIYSASNDVILGTGSGRNINVFTNAVNIITGNLDMYGNRIINVHDIGSYGNMNIQATNNISIHTAGSQLLSIGTDTTYPNNITFSNYGGYLGDVKINSYNITIGDGENGTIALNSGTSGYISLYAQYIEAQGNMYMNNNSILGIYGLNLDSGGSGEIQGVSNIRGNGNLNIYAGAGAGLGLNSPTYLNNNFIHDISAIGGHGGSLTVDTNMSMNGNYIANVGSIGGTTSSDLTIAANPAHNLLLNGQQIALTSSADLNLYSYGDTNIYTASSKNVNLVPDGNLNLTAAGTGKQISLYTPTLIANIQSDATFNCTNSFNVATSQVNVSGTAALLYSLLTSVKGVFQRWLGTHAINQPVIQYGTTTGTGASGSVTVTLPVAYTSGTSYIATATMMDVDAARISVNRDNLSSITIYWFQAGPGTQILGWNTMGL